MSNTNNNYIRMSWNRRKHKIGIDSKNDNNIAQVKAKTGASTLSQKQKVW